MSPASGAVALVSGCLLAAPAFAGDTPAGAADSNRARTVATVRVVGDFHLKGDLDGDGRAESVFLLATETGGSGVMVSLAVSAPDSAGARPDATAPIGDRVQLRAGHIEDRRIVLDLVQGGAHDPACCPGDLVTRTWSLKRDSLVEGPPNRTGRLSVGTLAGPEWVLRAWDQDAPAPVTPAVTLKLDHDRFVGGAGCNRYFAGVRSGGTPGELAIAPAGTTRMACPEEETAAESRFLRQLAGVRRMQFVAGRLGLAWATADGKSGVMLFDRRPAPARPGADRAPVTP